MAGQEQSGSSLGLAIAERAAERNDGRITLSGAPDAGRTLSMTVDFPLRR